MDIWNGSSSQVQTFKQQTGVTYPLCLKASGAKSRFSVPTQDYSVIIDQNGIIQYKGSGVNKNAVSNVIDNLLSQVTGVEENEIIPEGYVLQQNYPNPFNPTTRIAFEIDKLQPVSLKIYDYQGRFIRTLLNREMHSGKYNISWDARNQKGEPVVSGVYLYILQGTHFKETRKMLLLR